MRKSSHKILVTAGPTAEPIDPVRYISNRSTGLMGYEIARAAAEKGYEVCLITGPVHLPAPPGVEPVKVTTAREMRDEVMKRLDGADCLVMAAAVCDFRPARPEARKIKKSEKLTLDLVKNPDILREAGKREGLVKVGFALETEDIEKNARAKLEDKDMDLIIANLKSGDKDPFGGGGKEFIIMDRQGGITELKDITKAQCAEALVGRIKGFLG